MSASSPAVALHEMPAWLHDLLQGIDLPRARAVQHVRWDPSHSNDVFEVWFDDGRCLLLKRSRHGWAAAGFAASAAAAQLIAAESDLIVPQPLQPCTSPAVAVAVQVYWRIPLPTLAQVWPSLSSAGRQCALRSCGTLLRRLHAIALPGYGSLHGPLISRQLGDELDRDLRERLLPAVAAHWPAGVRHLDQLIELIPALTQLEHDHGPVLVHADLHTGNVLCRVRAQHVACVGLLDLDGAAGGAPEYDLAGFDVLHGPIFEQPIPYAVRQELRRGYGSDPDQRLIDFFRCVHLANQGFTSGFLGHDEHAARIETELHRCIRRLQRSWCTGPGPCVAVTCGASAGAAPIFRAGAAANTRIAGGGGVEGREVDHGAGDAGRGDGLHRGCPQPSGFHRAAQIGGRSGGRSARAGRVVDLEVRNGGHGARR